MRNTLKYLLLLVFGVATLWSCSDDNLSKNQNHSHSHSDKEPVFKIVSLSDIPNLGNKISSFKSEVPIGGMSFRTINNETNYFDLIIPYNVNSFVYDQANNLHHYTFALNIEETNTKTNLVAKETLSGEYEYHIFVFKPDDYQEWYNAIKNSDINYTKSTDFEAFELGEPENTTYSTMCLEAVEVWTCPWGVHTLGKDKWYECDSFGPGGGGINSWVRSYTYQMVTCGGGFGGGSSPVIPSDPNNPSNPNPGGGGGNGAGAIPNLTEPDPCVMSASVSFVDLLNDVQKAWWNSSSNTTERNQIQNFLGENGCNQGDTDFAKEIINFHIEEGNIKQKIQQAIANGITTTAEYTHSLFNKLSVLANNYPSSISYINQMMNGIRSFISTNLLVNTNPSTCTFTDLFNMWLFELGDNPFVISNNTATTTNQLKNQEGVSQARNIAISKIQNNDFSLTNHSWTYGQQEFYDGMANGNVVTAFLGSYNTKVTISSTPNGYQLNFQVSNTSSWESATRFRIDNDGDGIHDGVFPNTSRNNNNDISIGGNFTQNWNWTEPVN